MEANAKKFATGSSNDETIGFVTAPDPNFVGPVHPGPDVKLAAHAKTGHTARDSTARATVPPHTLAVVHGHVDSGPQRSDGMVDSTTAEHPLGDSQPVSKGLPNATESHLQISWHEMFRDQLQFTFPAGTMSPSQSRDMQQNLNSEQSLMQ